MAQPGASQVFLGGSVIYNTKKSRPLLLNNGNLYESILASSKKADTTLSEEEQYIQSKMHWTAEASVAYCEELGTDYAIAEGTSNRGIFRN